MLITNKAILLTFHVVDTQYIAVSFQISFRRNLTKIIMKTLICIKWTKVHEFVQRVNSNQILGELSTFCLPIYVEYTYVQEEITLVNILLLQAYGISKFTFSTERPAGPRG